MSTPVYDAMVGEVLQRARADRERLEGVRSAVDRLHPAGRTCPACRVPAPCETRRLVLGPADVPAEPEALDPVPPRMPRVVDLLDSGRTSRALDLLLGAPGRAQRRSSMAR